MVSRSVANCVRLLTCMRLTAAATSVVARVKSRAGKSLSPSGVFMVRQQTVDRCLNPVWAIASSRYCEHFLIGFTAQSISGRMAGTYYCATFEHMVILTDRLERADGLALEEALQRTCKFGKARDEPRRRKYHPDHRSDIYGRSFGNAGLIEPFAKVHYVYMSWSEPY